MHKASKSIFQQKETMEHAPSIFIVASTLREEVTGMLLLPRLRRVERLGIEYAEAPPAAIRTQAAVTFTIGIDI